MVVKQKHEAQNPLLLRAHRLMEAFAKSDDERDFHLDRQEGFILFADLDKSATDLHTLETELTKNAERYCLIPKLTFYETKKIMEGFVNEKVYDIDTKEKLLDIIQSKEARENFLEFIYDHHSELEKWQQFYQERSRIRIIEWLRNNHFHFVFEEDLDLAVNLMEKVKEQLFETKVGKDIQSARKAILSKAKTYYSSEALNPRPKRGRPPKQTQKLEVETQVTKDIYLTVPPSIRAFLFTPDITTASDITFSAKFESGEELIASLKSTEGNDADFDMQSLSKKLEDLRNLSASWMDQEEGATDSSATLDTLDDDSSPLLSDEVEEKVKFKPKAKATPKKPVKKVTVPKEPKKEAPKRLTPKPDSSKAKAKKPAAKTKPKPKKEAAKRKTHLRRTKKTNS